ncbi:galactose/methyl galactoside import ATP-binding protein MglA [Synergistales bacterium]|nr:galactose/methyl galactoside import ATP-binding protein MglA [Synergistales bacterium]
MERASYLLEITGLCKAFPGVQALDNARLSLRSGSIHALMGENGAGKSTMMKCLFGIYRKDRGEILFEGKPVSFQNPREALDSGVSMVHQELNQVSQRSVMENIWLGRFPGAGILVNERKMYGDTKKILENIGLSIDPKEKIENLSVSQRQMAEIARAISYNAKVIVLDEPTSSLTETEVEHLFEVIRLLRDKGCGIVYISHKMEEILAVSDEVTVMRDGRWVETAPAGALTTDKIISLIVGRELLNRFPKKENVPAEEVLLKVENLRGAYQPAVLDASFELHRGEILGIVGLMGSRRTEMVETIFGMRKKESGDIYVKGKKVNISSAKQAIGLGLSLVTEERRQTGIFDMLSVTFNTIIANLDAYCRFGVLNDAEINKDTDGIIQRLRIKTPSRKTKIQNLSGGNQQKVIIGRWLLTQSDIVMMDEPTRGIDVGSKYEIYQLINDLAKNGKAVLFVSSEMPEVLGLSDRILVMSGGRVAGVIDARGATQEEIMRLAAKYL